MLVIGAVLLAGAIEYSRARDGDGFLAIGAGLMVFIGVVVLLTMLANGADAYLAGGEDWEEWSAADDFSLALVAAIPAAAVLAYSLRVFQRKEAAPA